MTIPYQPRSKKKRRQIRLSEEHEQKAKDIGKGNVSFGISKALEAYHDEPFVVGIDWSKHKDITAYWSPESEKE